MPFNFQTFKTRALTAIVFVIIMLGGLLWNQWSFLVLFSIIHFGCWVEYQKLIKKVDPNYAKIGWVHEYSTMFAGWCFMLLMANQRSYNDQWPVATIGFWMLMLSTGIVYFNKMFFNKQIRYLLTAYSTFGVLYISLSFGLLMKLWGNLDQTGFTGSPDWTMPVILITSIWINDTMAYIVGSLIGKTPLSKISPKKTWEGTVGGAILAVVFVTSVGVYRFGFSAKHLLMISITAAIAGTLGDLLESKLKRMAGEKDSGQIMPGHGGFLDRFDSLLVAATAVWVIFKLFN